MEPLITVSLFLLLLSLLVLIHELGHFLTARKLGVVAEEFGLGLPPRIRKLFSWRGTEFTLNWLPIGGFVRMKGEDPTSLADGKIGGASREDEGFFYAQKPWKRAVILVSGVFMNALLGVAAFTVVYSVLGIPQIGERVRIDGVAEGSPAERAQLQAGDVIGELKVKREKLSLSEVEAFEVKDTTRFIDLVNAHRGEEIILVVERALQKREVAVVPRLESDTPEGQGAIGVVVSLVEFVHYPWWQMPGRASVVGAKEAVGWGRVITSGMGTMLRQLIFEGKVPSDIAGPVGIAKLTGKVAAAGWIPLVQFTGILSVNLAIINLLPIPALDGGRLLFLGIEKLRGRPISPRRERWMHAAGYAVLVGLIVLVTIGDILRR